MAYYTTTVKPTITASKMALGAYTAEDGLFGWTEITLPSRGTLKLTNIAIVLRGADGARHEIAMDLVFATKNTTTIREHTSVNAAPANHYIGNWFIDVKHYGDGLDFFAVGNTTTTNNGLIIPGQSDGKIYVAGICGVGSTPNFESTCQVSTETATNTTALVVKTKDAREVFAVGDVLHDEDDQVIGTIKTITNGTDLVLEENCASVSAVNKDLYNISPITLILGFEK
jgi:hypothetical protein